MKQMVYSKGMFASSLPQLILHEENIDGYKIYIINRRSHPCAYIDISKHFDSININDIDCHGGITFTGKKIPRIDEAHEGFYIGWDYAHYGDFFGANPFMRDKKYTTEEIFEDALNVVKQLKKLERKSLDDDRKNKIK